MVQYLTVIISALMTVVMPLLLLSVLGILLLLCVEMWALLNPTSRRLASGVVKEPGVGLRSPHFFVLNF